MQCQTPSAGINICFGMSMCLKGSSTTAGSCHCAVPSIWMDTVVCYSVTNTST